MSNLLHSPHTATCLVYYRGIYAENWSSVEGPHAQKSTVHIYLVYFRVLEQLMEAINTGRTESSPITLESGKVSLKNVGSHDKRVKKVLAEQRCVIITALEVDKVTIKTQSEINNARRRTSWLRTGRILTQGYLCIYVDHIYWGN